MAEVRHLDLERLGERVYRAEIGPGLAVYIIPKPGYAKRFAAFATRYGSIDNRFRTPEGEVLEVPDGIAHFLEHQLFAGEDGDAFDHFSRLGGSANAFTTFTQTTYLFSCTDRFEENLDLLLDFVQTPYFTPEGVAKERGIIEQEILMYRDEPRWRLTDNLREALFLHHPCRLDIAGTPETVRRIDADLLNRCYRTFYHPSNMVLSVVGAVDPDAVLAQVERDLAGRGHRSRAPVERYYPTEPEAVASTRVEARMSVSRPLFAIGFKERRPGLRGEALLEQELTTDLVLEILFGRGGALYNRLYEEGLIDDTFSTGTLLEEEFGLTTLSGETDDPDRLHDRLMREIERVRAEGVAPADVERVKRQFYGDFLAEFNSPEALAHLCNAAHFAGLSPFAHFEALRRITPDRVTERLREHFDPALHALSVVLPH